jgi:two-component system cell cycle sensor histidine kinase/response regulator CckA
MPDATTRSGVFDAYGNAARELAPAFESARDACFFVYFDLQIGFLNAAARRDVVERGGDPAAYVGARLWDVLGYTPDMPARQAVEWVIRRREPVSFCMRGSVQEKSWVENDVVPMPTGILIWYRDARPQAPPTPVPTVLTEEPATKVVNVRTSYISIQRLAGGIAHDINNLVTAIKGSVAELQEADATPEQVAYSAQRIEAAADRAASLTAELLAFSRRLLLRPTLFDLGAHLRTITPTLAMAFDGIGKLRVELDGGLGDVYADCTQVERAILNIVKNARDAIRGWPNGTVTIRARNVELNTEFDHWQVEGTPGPFIQIDVEDNGPGIDAEMREHLFEPFFTTKGVGIGAGLGLATTYGIIKQSGGYIWANSNDQTGTVFSIYLPCAVSAYGSPRYYPASGVSAPSGNGASSYERPAGNEHILLVEDEEAIRRVARRSLEAAGYRITEAPDGATALDLAQQEEFDLLVTDVEMPRMRGTTLVKRLKDLRPGLPVLFMSGHSDQLLADGTIDASTPFLAKPFTPPQLAEKVRETIANAREYG